jgi:hypothetical protein
MPWGQASGEQLALGVLQEMAGARDGSEPHPLMGEDMAAGNQSMSHPLTTTGSSERKQSPHRPLNVTGRMSAACRLLPRRCGVMAKC